MYPAFFYDPSNKVFPARVIPVNASAADFPLGNTLIYNVTAAAVSAKFGAQVVTIGPGRSEMLTPPRSGSGEYPVAIDYSFPGDKQPSALCRSTWQHEENARQILFVTPSPGQKIPRIWGILERQEQGEQKKGE